MSGFPARFPIAMHEKLVALQAAVSSIERRLEAHPSQQATHDRHAASQIDDGLNCDPIKLHLTGATRWHFALFVTSLKGHVHKTKNSTIIHASSVNNPQKSDLFAQPRLARRVRPALA
jgi:hypothetical protein